MTKKEAVTKETESNDDQDVTIDDILEPEVEDTSDSELERLRKENAKLKASQAPTPVVQDVQPAVVTSAQLRVLNDKQWETIEEQYGKTRDEILGAVERQELARDNVATKARLNVSDAMDYEVDADPTVLKLKTGIKEYFSGISLEEKSDPEKVKQHMARAKIYARGRLADRGKVPPKARAAGGGKVEDPKPEGSVEDEAPIMREGEIKPGSEIRVGNLSLKVSDLTSKELREATKHPDDPNGVMFKSFDKVPVFKRGV